MSIETMPVSVTPDQAHEWLEEHYKRIEANKFLQRPVVQSVVNRYAADMQQGAWLLCPQPICFDEDGNLLDGQHRLEAIMKSKVTVKMMMSTGWPATGNGRLTTMDVIDRGKVRSIANQMHLHGYQNANNYAASVAAMGRLVHHAGACSQTLAGVMYVLDQLDMRNHIDRVLAKQTGRDFRGRVIGPLAYYHTAHPKKAEEFTDHAFNFTAAKGSPVQRYLLWVKNNSGMQTDDHLKALCVCLRAWTEGTEISFVRVANTEAVAWMAGLNPKLRDNIRAVLPRTR